MREIESSVYIEAQPEQVWRVLVDFPRYSDWNPYIRAVERDELKPGAQMNVVVQLPNGELTTYRPTLLKVVPASELRWRTRLWLFGFYGEHAFLIEPERTGTKLTQRETYSGWMASMLALSFAAKARPGFEQMNQRLKQVVEAKF